MGNTGYWVILLNSYDLDGVEFLKGRMDYYTSTSPIVNSDWRRATEDEISKRQYNKGQAYLPPNYWTF